MSDNTVEKQYGFVCPEWARLYWNQNECTVEPTTDGDFAVLDHSIQSVVFRGKTREECASWLD